MMKDELDEKLEPHLPLQLDLESSCFGEASFRFWHHRPPVSTCGPLPSTSTAAKLTLRTQCEGDDLRDHGRVTQSGTLRTTIMSLIAGGNLPARISFLLLST
jgi:hypothetical protein